MECHASYSGVVLAPCTTALALASSRARHPHDRVVPWRRVLLRTSVILPQSHRHLHLASSVLSPSPRSDTKRRPNRLPVRLMIRPAPTSATHSRRKHPHDLVRPLTRELAKTSTTCPQEHLHRHMVLPLALDAIRAS